MSDSDLPKRDTSGTSEAAVQGAVGSGQFVCLQGGESAGIRAVDSPKPNLTVVDGGGK